jgi:NitT/TauT family transport system substrate-binding protein
LLLPQTGVFHPLEESPMSAPIRTILTLAALAAAPFAAHPQAPLTEVRVTLNAPFDGSNAAFFLADERGYYAAEGLKVNMDPSGGSGEVATRVGSGTYDFGFGDINVLMEFNAKNPANAGRSVYMLYYRSPLSVASFSRAGIGKPADLNGRKMGGSLSDGAYKLFPAYSNLAGVQPDSIKWEYGDLRLREAMLLKGDVDAILGFDSTMYFSLVRQGIKPEDIKFLYYSDAGLDIYGNSLVASKKILEGNPKAVRGWVAASAKGWRDAIANPAAAVAALKKRAPLVDEKLETEKLMWLIKNQIVTAESKADGLGGIRTERMTRAVDTLTKAFGLSAKPAIADVYSAEFLPPADMRKLP